MSIFDRFFKSKDVSSQEPKIKFGRYSDAYKSPSRLHAWDEAQDLFEKEQYIECYKAFFTYLRDDNEDNVRFEVNRKGLTFELYQGSKKIIGTATTRRVKVEAKVVNADSFNVGVMRRLLEQNFSLRYSRFALDESGNVTIVFDTLTIDGSPYKLYYALQELATKADKQDDLLVEEFRNLENVDTDHLESLPQQEKEIKYQYIKAAIENALQEIESPVLRQNSYSRSIGYLLLDIVFKLDYLIKPEGFMMETLEHIHRQYYQNDGLSIAQKNKILCNGLRELIKRPKEDFFKEMYRVRSTFGITHSVNHDRVASLIYNELPTMDWYQNNGHDALALSIPGYIVGYCMFNYAVPKPDRDLMHLYYQIIESDYFRALGFPAVYYDAGNKRFDKKGIKKAIQKIVEHYKSTYPNFNPNYTLLKYDNKTNFCRSYLQMIGSLDLAKTE